MVLPKDPVTSLGWKTYGDCMINLDDEMVNCVEENAYSAQDVFISNENNKFNPIYEKGKIAEIFAASLNQSIKVKPFYANQYNAIVYDLVAEAGVMSQKLSVDEGYLTNFLILNNSISYFISFTDPKLMIASMRPDPVPRLWLELDVGKQNYVVYVKVDNLNAIN